MKTSSTLFSITAAVLFVAAFALPQHSPGATDPDAAAVANLIRELQVQQAATLENHARIDAKLVTIEEELRQARIFVARGGKVNK